MEKPNLQSQGMLKMLQDLYELLKVERQQSSIQLWERVGMAPKYWAKLRGADIITNLSRAPSKPVYKWNTIEPNIYMAVETLRDYPDYGNPKINEVYQMFKDVPIPQKNTIPPKHEWVRDYCEKRKNGIDPASFMNYYNRNEWMVKISGKMQPMLNWQAAIHTWEANQKRPIQVKQVVNTKDIPLNQLVNELELRGYAGIGIGWITDDKLLAELKRRGYSGDINKKIEF